MNLKQIKSVAIVGAGTMGQGIALACSSKGFDVSLYDISEEAIKKGLSGIERNLQLGVDKGKISTEQQKSCLDKIKPQNKLEQLKADLIIEAAVEKLDVKKEIFKILEKNNTPDTILTTNTSSIPITQIGADLKNPKRFAGLHFFNPANIMKLVEIINGVNTTTETIATLKDFTSQLGKISVIAKDSPGFIVNRVARHYYVEALKLVEENISDLESTDKLLKASGFKMGPFELMDLIGIDVNFSVTSSMFNGFHFDPKFRPSRIQQQKVDAGHHGKKSGQGFYDYSSQ
jgi:3-hydroxybutyryl-CoA dehydrogenase